MMALSRLGLGTAQFGASYGISNQYGRPGEREIATIIARAVESGVSVLDTAAAYGDAEDLIGRYLPSNHGLRIITKVGPFREERFSLDQKQNLLDEIARSLDRLRTDHVHGLLVHHASDLDKPGWEYLIEGLREAKARGWARRIGASVYGAEDLALVESRIQPELVQLPLNVLDRRFLYAEQLPRLKKVDTEIHVRSVFLQGLLLMSAAKLPSYFSPVRADIMKISQQWKSQHVSALAGCLAFAMQQPEIDTVIVGLNRCSELEEIEAVVAGLVGRTIEFSPISPVDPIYLDPSRWPAFTY